MKIFRLSLVFILFVFLTKDNAAQETRHRAFFAPVLKNTSMLDQYAAVAGARGGWIINRTFVLGAAFYAVANKIKTSYSHPDHPGAYYLDLNYGGLEFELVYPSDYVIHGSFIMFCGGGGGKLKPENKNGFSPYGLSLIIWEPQLNLEFKLKNWLHLDTGLSYRMITGFDEYAGFKPKDISGLSGIISLKFGSY